MMGWGGKLWKDSPVNCGKKKKKSTCNTIYGSGGMWGKENRLQGQVISAPAGKNKNKIEGEKQRA